MKPLVRALILVFILDVIGALGAAGAWLAERQSSANNSEIRNNQQAIHSALQAITDLENQTADARRQQGSATTAFLTETNFICRVSKNLAIQQHLPVPASDPCAVMLPIP